MTLNQKAPRAMGAAGIWNVVSLAGNDLENSRSRRPPQAQSSLRLKFLASRLHALGPMIDFERINRAALSALPAVLARILPSGKIVAREYVALNPRRADHRLGSFKINLRSGRWADFATGDKGGDPVSLFAYVEAVSQAEAARRLARMLGLDTREGRRHG